MDTSLEWMPLNLKSIDIDIKHLWSECNLLPRFPDAPVRIRVVKDPAFLTHSAKPCLLREVIAPPDRVRPCPPVIYDWLQQAVAAQQQWQHQLAVSLLQKAMKWWQRKGCWTALWRLTDAGAEGEGIDREVEALELTYTRKLMGEEDPVVEETVLETGGDGGSGGGNDGGDTADEVHADQDADQPHTPTAQAEAGDAEDGDDAGDDSVTEEEPSSTEDDIGDEDLEEGSMLATTHPDVSAKMNLSFELYVLLALGSVYLSAGVAKSSSFRHLTGKSSAEWKSNNNNNNNKGNAQTLPSTLQKVSTGSGGLEGVRDNSVVTSEQEDVQRVSSSLAGLGGGSKAVLLNPLAQDRVVGSYRYKGSHRLSSQNDTEEEPEREALRSDHLALCAFYHAKLRYDEYIHEMQDARGENDGSYGGSGGPLDSMDEKSDENDRENDKGHNNDDDKEESGDHESLINDWLSTVVPSSKSRGQEPARWLTDPESRPQTKSSRFDRSLASMRAVSRGLDPQADAARRSQRALANRRAWWRSVRPLSPFEHPSPVSALIYSQIGVAAYYLGRFDYALRCFYVSQQIRFHTLPESSPEYVDVTTTLNNIGVCLYTFHRYYEADAYFTAAYEVAIDRLQSVHPRVTAVLQNLDCVASKRHAVDVEVHKWADALREMTTRSWTVSLTPYERMIKNYGAKKKKKKAVRKAKKKKW